MPKNLPSAIFSILLGVGVPQAADADVIFAGFTLAGSDQSFETRTIPKFTGERSVYLWWTDTQGYTASAFEFGLTGDFEIVDVIPKQGLVNTGTLSTIESVSLIVISQIGWVPPGTALRL